jgi:hypothetical protein
MILDEIKKKSFTLIKFEQMTEPTSLYKPRVFVDLADIEKILGEMKCEKCRYYDNYPKGLGECKWFSSKTKVDYIFTDKDFYCSQFEVKE